LPNVLDRFSLHGRIALVTAGAGPLFGSSITEALAEPGATVITASRSLERNEEYATQLRTRGCQAHGMLVDLEDTASIDRLHDELIARFGRLDVLVNSALARDGHAGRFEAQSPETLAHAAVGDFVGLFRISQRFLPDMVRQGRGSIINISSIYGVVSNDPTICTGTDMVQPASYTFVKGGMINFTRYLACYYGKQGVRANCISPGGYFNDQPQAFVENYTRRVPLGRMMDHLDIQGAVVFLASDASSYVTGANLMVDGGWTSLGICLSWAAARSANGICAASSRLVLRTSHSARRTLCGDGRLPIATRSRAHLRASRTRRAKAGTRQSSVRRRICMCRTRLCCCLARRPC
jgi:NAD(P)-dependent dehydrogenase (short-subunit alcohol dehydrogenase family)